MDSDQAARRDAILEAWLSQRLDSVKETNAINDTDEMTQSDERSYSLYKDSIGLSQNKTDRFYRCWGHSNCGSCLGTSACSWCPFVRFLLEEIGHRHLAFLPVYKIHTYYRTC